MVFDSVQLVLGSVHQKRGHFGASSAFGGVAVLVGWTFWFWSDYPDAGKKKLRSDRADSRKGSVLTMQTMPQDSNKCSDQTMFPMTLWAYEKHKLCRWLLYRQKPESYSFPKTSDKKSQPNKSNQKSRICFIT